MPRQPAAYKAAMLQAWDSRGNQVALPLRTTNLRKYASLEVVVLVYKGTQLVGCCHGRVGGKQAGAK